MKAKILVGCSAAVALCGISMAAELTPAPKTVTYTKDVAPIFQERNANPAIALAPTRRCS